MSVPVTTGLPPGFQRVAWPGRLGPVAAVAGAPPVPTGAALLIPGFTGSKEDYFAMLPGLLARGWAIAAADLPGMFESAGTESEQDHTLDLLADDVVRMARAWSDSLTGSPAIHLVGHSVGGIVAREAALQAPEALASLTLYASGPGAVGGKAAADARMLRSALESITPAQVHQVKVQMDLAAGSPAPPAPIAEFLQRRWAQTTSGHLMALAGIAIGAPDRVAALAALSASGKLPLFVLYGSLDVDIWGPGAFADLARSLGAQESQIEGVGHSPAVESPDQMVDRLDAFWRVAV